jgi:hypothetical protein
MRYASMVTHLSGWIGPASAGGCSFEDADVACIQLPTASKPEAGVALMRLILRDFGSCLVDPNRRQHRPDDSPKRVVIIIEEAGAVAGDAVIGRRFVNQVERNHNAGAYSVLTARDPTGLGGGHTWSALSTNAAVLTYRQTEQGAGRRDGRGGVRRDIRLDHDEDDVQRQHDDHGRAGRPAPRVRGIGAGGRHDRGGAPRSACDEVLGGVRAGLTLFSPRS